MGCGGSSLNRDSNHDIRAPKVTIRVGTGARELHPKKNIIFVFGGPGSKKGRIVEDLVRMYGFRLINAEDLLLKQAAKMTESDKDHFLAIRKYIKDNPQLSSLRSILDLVKREVDHDIHQTYLVNIMPNLKSCVKTEDFHSDCTAAMLEFEEQYPINFALNMALPADRLIKQVEAESAKHTSTKPVPGEQTDEADSTRTQKRALLYQNSVQCFLDYFQETDRMVTVDVSSGVNNLIWERVREFFLDSNFLRTRMVNSVTIFVFNGDDRSQLAKMGITMITLRALVDDQFETPERLLEQLCTLLEENDPTVPPVAIDLTETTLESGMTENCLKQRIKFYEMELGTLQKYALNLENCKVLPEYKAVISTEEDVYLFPKQTSNVTCVNIALTLSHLREITQDSSV